MTTTPEYANGGIVSGDILVPSCDSAKPVGATRHADSAPACNTNQLPEDILQYFSEWNDQEIADKKLALYFACVSGKIEDIQRLEAEIETLRQQLHKK